MKQSEINLIQFYDSPEESDYYTQIQDTNISNIKAVVLNVKDSLLPPFQVSMGDSITGNYTTTITHVHLNTGVETDITGWVDGYKFSVGTDVYFQARTYNDIDRTIPDGCFYLKMKFKNTAETIEVLKYSDVLFWGNGLDREVKITYNSDTQIRDIFYQTGFINSAVLRGELEQAESEVTEELKIRNNVELPVQTITVSNILLKILCSNSVRNALMNINLHEYTTVEVDGIIYEAKKRCSITSSYIPSNDMHEVLITVPYDVVVWRESDTNNTITPLTELGDFNNDFNDDFKI